MISTMITAATTYQRRLSLKSIGAPPSTASADVAVRLACRRLSLPARETVAGGRRYAASASGGGVGCGSSSAVSVSVSNNLTARLSSSPRRPRRMSSAF